MDLTTAKGEGLVFVWALGLPFLPGSRDLPLPRQRPSLHLATYRAGAADLYLLKELPPEAVVGLDENGSGSWGDSRIMVTSRDGEGSTPSVTLEAKLRLPVVHGAGPLEVDLNLTGPSVRVPAGTLEQDHVWSPRSLVAHGEAKLRYGGDEQTLAGPAYLDGNCAKTPLHEQGIQSWRWGRASFSDRTVVYYQTTPSGSSASPEEGESPATVLLQKVDGTFRKEQVGVTFSRTRRGHFGLRTTRRVTFHLGGDDYEIHLRDLVDDGPFYQRFLAEADCKTAHGERVRGHGIAEYVVPSRVDQPWQRPFVRMKTDQVSGRNSPFLPLFTGPAHGRSDRLARSLLGAWGS